MAQRRYYAAKPTARLSQSDQLLHTPAPRDTRGSVIIGPFLPPPVPCPLSCPLYLVELRFPEVRQDWCQVALQWALICTSRHYACRSFQMCRALDIHLNASTTQQIVSRLAEAVADTSEDVQASCSICSKNRIIPALGVRYGDSAHSQFRGRSADSPPLNIPSCTPGPRDPPGGQQAPYQADTQA